jgi:hypothetical protein
MVIISPLASVRVARERDTGDTASTEECRELFHFTSLVTEYDNSGKFDWTAREESALGMGESILSPYAPNAAFNICILIPARPFGMFCSESTRQVV